MKMTVRSTTERRAALSGAMAAALLLVAAMPAAAAERAFRVTPFSELQLELPGAYLVREAAAPSVRLHGPAEVLEHIVVDQTGETVHIYATGNLSIRGPLEIEVTTLGLKKLAVTGAGSVEGRGFSAEEFALSLTGAANIKLNALNVDSFKADLSGSGDVAASGHATKENVKISGAIRYHAVDLAAAKVEVKLSGAGDAEVFARDKLRAEVSGAGTVHYRGGAKVSSSVSGAGSVIEF
jgi:hypothetical protein